MSKAASAQWAISRRFPGRFQWSKKAENGVPPTLKSFHYLFIVWPLLSIRSLRLVPGIPQARKLVAVEPRDFVFPLGRASMRVSWSRLSEQNLRVDKWSPLPGVYKPPARSGGRSK